MGNDYNIPRDFFKYDEIFILNQINYSVSGIWSMQIKIFKIYIQKIQLGHEFAA